MIDTVRKNYKFDRDYMIMVLDTPALKVFSSCCKFFELYNSNLYHVEKLEVKRKRFPKTDAIYFISPSEKSITHLINDFKDYDETKSL